LVGTLAVGLGAKAVEPALLAQPDPWPVDSRSRP
jgi:hypothetical protein